MSTRVGLLFLAVLAAFYGCTKNDIEQQGETQCLKVRYHSTYCPSKKPLHLIQFLEPTRFATKQTVADSVIYLAAVADLPPGVQKNDSVFFMRFHHDPAVEEGLKPSICQAVFSLVTIVQCEGVSGESCETLGN